jgi:hypothetical protein
MKNPRLTKRAKAGDKAVAIGGFLAVLLTGFFGAEPDAAMQAGAGAPMATTAPYAPGARAAELYLSNVTLAAEGEFLDFRSRDCAACRE